MFDAVPATALVEVVAGHFDALDAEAARLDRDGGFPDEGFGLLRAAGALLAPLPRHVGGQGIGTEPAGGLALLSLLRTIGRASLSLGRLYEGHVNALKLIVHYGTDAQVATAADDVRDGHVFGIWVTEGPDPVRLIGTGATSHLAGEKLFASGACVLTRPLITAQPADGPPRMVVARLGSDRNASPTVGGLTGMRGAATGRCDFTGMPIVPEQRVGAPGDYLRQPEFSAGAWRGIAVALGGIDRLVDTIRDQLARRGRAGNPHQAVRIGEALIARETASMWARRAALLAEGGMFEPGDVAATVNLARIACEQAGLTVIQLTQRALGLQGFLQTNQAERVMRDLATYLRQPAPDETLVEAAMWFTGRDLPDPERRP
ncbi:acyl-CoA dehydrogenase [Lichenicola cladoniae]|uniref:Acyl-CoA dehydrogenase n=1 Tax=Lichenicola cladoniae TaxID=1484109 RepID=A0A6M8HTR7_9PROT|nr:acyl-CoA dehydrogenase family protein [Lichenicola cladoniae]NPD67675.1 acyl-CoA dehydrogenase [Acetobacteraceae bacterium]QKE91615.1 acyl-CoA dehydrogenase [Lichenicola cladoniae]